VEETAGRLVILLRPVYAGWIVTSDLEANSINFTQNTSPPLKPVIIIRFRSKLKILAMTPLIRLS
jgi:hypothetical protein